MRSIMRGFTLVELMIVVVVVSILAAVAIPSYRNYVMRSQRTDATTALLRIQAAEEKFFLQNNAYSTNLVPAPPNGLGMADRHGRRQLRRLVFNGDAGGAGVSYVATATAAAGQLDDVKCQTFTIDQNGTRQATGSGANPTQECWRR